MTTTRLQQQTNTETNNNKKGGISSRFLLLYCVHKELQNLRLVNQTNTGMIPVCGVYTMLTLHAHAEATKCAIREPFRAVRAGNSSGNGWGPTCRITSGNYPTMACSLTLRRFLLSTIITPPGAEGVITYDCLLCSCMYHRYANESLCDFCNFLLFGSYLRIIYMQHIFHLVVGRICIGGQISLASRHVTFENIFHLHLRFTSENKQKNF